MRSACVLPAFVITYTARLPGPMKRIPYLGGNGKPLSETPLRRHVASYAIASIEAAAASSLANCLPPLWVLMANLQ